MSKRDWWLGITMLMVALLVHAALPRYEWRTMDGWVVVRVDRWTGHASAGRVSRAGDVVKIVFSE